MVTNKIIKITKSELDKLIGYQYSAFKVDEIETARLISDIMFYARTSSDNTIDRTVAELIEVYQDL